MKEIQFEYDGVDLKNLLKKNIFVMKKLDLINNEGANLKIKRYQYTLNKGFDIIDQWGVVCKNMNMEEVINWLDGRTHIDDSQENRWIWTEQGTDSRTPLFKVIHFLITPQLR